MTFRRQPELACHCRNACGDLVETHVRFALKTLAAGITLTALANGLDGAPIRLSTFESGLTYRNDLAYQARDRLTEVVA